MMTINSVTEEVKFYGYDHASKFVDPGAGASIRTPSTMSLRPLRSVIPMAPRCSSR